MITLSDNGTTKITVFANPYIDNSHLSFTLFLTKQTWVYENESWAEIVDARKEKWKKIVLDNNVMVDYTTGLLAVLDEETGTYPETSVGAYNYICSINVGGFGDASTLVYVGMAKQIEDFITNNNLVSL